MRERLKVKFLVILGGLVLFMVVLIIGILFFQGDEIVKQIINAIKAFIEFYSRFTWKSLIAYGLAFTIAGIFIGRNFPIKKKDGKEKN